MPARDGVLRGAHETPPESVERRLNQCLLGPETTVERLPLHDDLLANLTRRLEEGLSHGDADALLDVHRSAYTVYETLLGHPLSQAARHERSAWFNAFRSHYEENVLAADIKEIADRLPSEADARRPGFVREWFLTAAKERNDLDRAVETYLAEKATIEQLAAFIQADGYLNYRFYDALVLAQPHFMEGVKHEISKHMWDECGEGRPDAAHTLQFTRGLRRLGLELPTVPPWEDWRPVAGHNLYFLLACNRRHYLRRWAAWPCPSCSTWTATRPSSRAWNATASPPSRSSSSSSTTWRATPNTAPSGWTEWCCPSSRPNRTPAWNSSPAECCACSPCGGTTNTSPSAWGWPTHPTGSPWRRAGDRRGGTTRSPPWR
ncbi:iron-containing redox enzyme family protein [Streptomyces tricolor]|nr:iron-containing redox enzyme family protein [Streptomyces tricolor]